MITDHRTLEQFLTELDSPRDDWFVYVDPADINDWRMGYCKFHYGERIPIGPLSKISFAKQSDEEALLSVLHQKVNRKIGWVEYKGRTVLLNVNKVLDLYKAGKLHHEFESFLRHQITTTKTQWARQGASAFVNDVLPYQLSTKTA